MTQLIKILIFLVALGLSMSSNAQRSPINLADSNFSGEGLVNGISASQSECALISNAVWARVDINNAECIRYWKAGFPADLNTNDLKVLFYVPGDQIVAGKAELTYSTRNPKMMQELANLMQGRIGVPFILISTPGTFGSSGEHSQRRRPLESKLMSAALDEIKKKHSISDLSLVGLSGGGHIVASLLNRRSDIVCAVLASAVSAPKTRWQSLGLLIDVTGHADSYEPIEFLDAKNFHPHLRSYILGDRTDTNTPWLSQLPIAEKLKSIGANVEVLNGLGGGPQRHAMGESGRVIGSMCLRGKSNVEIKELEKQGFNG
jgi:hypothetical protein